MKNLFKLPRHLNLLPVRYRAPTLLFAFCWSVLGNALATSVYVTALGDNKAEAVINGSKPGELWVGDTSFEGVKLRSVTDGAAIFEIDGKLWTLRAGQGTYSEATLQADRRGQFFLTAQVNGMPVRAVIDTGATSVSMSSEDANRLGINYLLGRRITVNTANGPATAYQVILDSVQVGEIVLTNVQGSIIEGGRTQVPLVLIGMSFLRHVDMQRSGNTMQLLKRDY